jgi:uncharacterized delta-60 repeat protein
MKKCLLALLAACCNAAFIPVLAQESSLDPTFGTNGKVWTVPNPRNITTNTPPELRPLVLVQSTGAMVLVNMGASGGLSITRYQTDGAVDNSFGSNGTLVYNSADGLYRPMDVQLGAGDKMYIAGRTEPSAGNAYGVLRLNANGSLDGSFGSNGKAVINVSGGEELNPMGMALDAMGRVLMTTGIGPNIYVFRLTAGGQPDNSFSGDGTAVGNYPNGVEDAWDVVAHPDGRVLVSGTVTNTVFSNGQNVVQYDPAVFAFSSTGDVINSFGANGVQSIVTGSVNDEARNIAIEPGTNNIVVSGSQVLLNDGDQTLVYVARWLPDGTPDNSFSGDAIWWAVVQSGRAWGTDLGIQADGKILMSATRLCDGFCSFPGRLDILLYRLTSAGTPDASFAANGFVELNYAPFIDPNVNPGSIDVGGSFAAQGNKLIVAGMSRHQGVTRDLLLRLNTTSPIVTKNPPAPPPVNYTAIPAKIEAEAYNAMNGVLLENTSDAGGGQNVGWQDNGDWMEYNINVPADGDYRISCRVASMFTGQKFNVLVGSGPIAYDLTVPNTGGFQNWTTIATDIYLRAGQQTIKIQTSNNAGGWNLNWFRIDPRPTPYLVSGIPQKLEAENFRESSEIQLEPTIDVGGGEQVVFYEDNEYPSQYIRFNNYSSPVTGSVLMRFRVASPVNGASIGIIVNNGGTYSVDVPNTGGFNNWQTVSVIVPLVAGGSDIRITFGGTVALNWIQFDQPVTNTHVNIPARIQAEDFVAMNGILTEPTADAGGGLNVGWQDDGDWMDYNINVPSNGVYTLNLRVATMFSGFPQFVVKRDGGTVVATVNVPNTGGFQNWQTLSVQVPLAAGPQTIRIQTTHANGGWNLNWLEFTTDNSLTYVTIPARIQAEDYTAMSGVLTEPTADVGGGLNVGWQDMGDWMEYRINVPAAGTYPIRMRLASEYAQQQFEITSSAAPGRLLLQNAPAAGGFQGWITTNNQIQLPAGPQTLRFTTVNQAGGWNMNWFEIGNLPAATTQAPAKGITSDAGKEVANKATLQLAPNPVADRTSLQINGAFEGRLGIEVVNASGQVLKREFFNKQKGSAVFPLSMSELSRGVYILRVQTGADVQAIRFMKL